MSGVKQNDSSSFFVVKEKASAYVHVIISSFFSEHKIDKKDWESLLRDLLNFHSHIICDVSKNAYIGKDYLTLLILLSIKMEALEKKLILFGIKKETKFLIRGLGIDKKFKMRSSIEEAKESILK